LVAYVQGLKEDGDWPEDYDCLKGPVTVWAVARLVDDVRCLRYLTHGDRPTLRRVRGQKVGKVLYGFGNASKSAFGATIQIDEDIHYRYGQWCSEIVENESSNWKELSNLVTTLKEVVKSHGYQGYEIFMFTDNTTAEAAYWKGTTKSRPLFDLVLELKRLELDEDLILHVVHVSGKRMIAQGTDGLSRADHTEGVMQGLPIGQFVPLHLDPFVRVPELKQWLQSVTRGLNPVLLKPEGWYTEGHGRGTFVWAPAPAAAEVAAEQIGRARLKHPGSMHIVIVPRVMTGRWRRTLTQGSEFYLKLDWPEVWDLKTNFEPLLLFVCIPYRSESPCLPEQEKLLDKF
jgi:hypothetical protein